MENQEIYIYSKIVLMNIEKIRKSFTIKMVLDVLCENIYRFLSGDQDLIDTVFTTGRMTEIF